jgi:hypothetical protein
MKKIGNYDDWELSSSKIFWGEIAPCDHVVQIYENDETFLEVLSGFVGGGINSGDCVIAIATEQHLAALDNRLWSIGVHVDSLISNGQYIPIIAEEALKEFMVSGWPDEEKFRKFLNLLLKRARKHNRPVRAFGEMVALLWAEGNSGATVRLEHLWEQFCASENFCLFCAYPKTGTTQDIMESLQNICSSHTKMITTLEKPMTELYFRNIEKQAHNTVSML